MRTTIDLDAVVLKDLKRLQKEEGRTLGALMSELLSAAIKARRRGPPPKGSFRLKTFSMGQPLVDLSDKQAVQTIFDEEES